MSPLLAKMLRARRDPHLAAYVLGTDDFNALCAELGVPAVIEGLYRFGSIAVLVDNRIQPGGGMACTLLK